MSNVALFGLGFLVTLLTALGLGLLVWGAILDGRYNESERRRERELRARAREQQPSPPPRAA